MHKLFLAMVGALILLGDVPQADALGSRDANAIAAMESFAGDRSGVLVWQSRRTGPIRLFASGLDGSNLRQLTPDVSGKDHIAPLISPDGTRVIYYQTATMDGDSYYDDHLGEMMIVQSSDTKGSTAKVLVNEVRTYFECRFARWIDDDTIAYIGKDHHTYTYSISGNQSTQIFTYPLAKFGAIPNRQLTYAIDGFNRVFEIKTGQATQKQDFNGCEGNMSRDGKWAYRVEGDEHDFTRMKLGTWGEEIFFENDNSLLPVSQNYIYFPQISNCQRYLALGVSPDQHDHFNSDYDIFLVEINPTTFKATKAVKFSFDDALDAYPDIWIAPDAPVTPELTTIEVTGSNAYILNNGEVQFTARLKDQQGAPFAAEVSWSVSGGGSVTPAASSGAVDQSTTTLQSDGTAGTFTVTASSGGISGSTSLEVVDLIFPLKINCGSNDHDVSGWIRDDLFVEGGKDWVNDNEVNTAGAQGAAPAEVYRSMRHQTPHSYRFPLPDGIYRLRIHFADAYDHGRSMSYTVEGQQVLSDFDVTTVAGGVNLAHVEQFEVTVDDGDGLQIEASGTDDVFEAGLELEVLAITEPPPMTDAGALGPTPDGGVGLADSGGNTQLLRPELIGGCATGQPASGGDWGLFLVLATLLLIRRRRQG